MQGLREVSVTRHFALGWSCSDTRSVYSHLIPEYPPLPTLVYSMTYGYSVLIRATTTLPRFIPSRSTDVAPKGQNNAENLPVYRGQNQSHASAATGREYHKDTRFPGLQLCITSAGTATYYLVKRIGGKPTRVRLGTVEQLSVEQARNIAATIAGEVASGRDPQAERQKRRAAPTLDNVWFQWLEVHAKPHKRTWKEDERMYGRCLKVFHARRIATIRPAEVAAWHTQLGETNGHYLANRAKALLSTLCNYAIRLEMIVVSPCRSVPSFPEQSRERFLAPL